MFENLHCIGSLKMRRAILFFLLICLIIHIVCYISKTVTKPVQDYEQEEGNIDSIISLSYEIRDIVGDVFLNQDYYLANDIKVKKAINDSIINFDTNSVYVYISPLSCWSCVKSIHNHLSVIDNRNLKFLVSEKFTDVIKTFLDYVDIPLSQVYFISESLGLPIEETDKVFLFTVNYNRRITNVFPPTKYSKETTEAYFNSIKNQKKQKE